MTKNFLTMGTTDRLRLVMFVLLVVGSLLLWPIFFSAKVDGETSSSWVALWTPLWVYDALGKEEALGGEEGGYIGNETVGIGGGGEVELRVLLNKMLMRCHQTIERKCFLV